MHLLLWLALEPHRLSSDLRATLDDQRHTLVFSVASLWEIAIKHGLGRRDFRVDPSVLRRGLLDNLFDELTITGAHAVVVGSLPPIHKDPFDRILVAQSMVEGITLLTTDPVVLRYPGPLRRG